MTNVNKLTRCRSSQICLCWNYIFNLKSYQYVPIMNRLKIFYNFDFILKHQICNRWHKRVKRNWIRLFSTLKLDLITHTNYVYILKHFFFNWNGKCNWYQNRFKHILLFYPFLPVWILWCLLYISKVKILLSLIKKREILETIFA